MISSDLISSSLIFSLAEFNLLLKLSVVWNLIVQVLFGSFSNLIIFVIFHSFNPLFLLKFKYNYVAYLIIWTYIYIRILITVLFITKYKKQYKYWAIENYFHKLWYVQVVEFHTDKIDDYIVK